jgi:uncharacterized protein involved in outer membrane biogenesis
MKRRTKFYLGAVAALVLILAAALVAVALSLDGIVKRGIEKYGPSATGVDVQLKSAEVRLFAGRAQLDGLVVGNPKGCKTPTAIVAGKVSARIKPSSVFSHKVVLESVEFDAPVVTFEGGLRDNNLTKIEKNMGDFCASLAGGANSPAASTAPAKPKKIYQVNDLAITGAKVQVNSTMTMGQTVTISIPDIHLTNLGTRPEGITAADVAERALHAVLEAATAAVKQNAADLSKQAADAARSAAQKAADSLKGLIH